MRSEIISLPFYDIRRTIKWPFGGQNGLYIVAATHSEGKAVFYSVAAIHSEGKTAFYSVAAILIHSWRAGINKNLRRAPREHAASIIRWEWRSAISL